jgi:hypothetical protein
MVANQIVNDPATQTRTLLGLPRPLSSACWGSGEKPPVCKVFLAQEEPAMNRISMLSDSEIDLEGFISA